MELIFVRHGEGEHTIQIPESLKIADPSLTDKGKLQAKTLRNKFSLTPEDIVIVSPIRRTLETARIWMNNSPCRKVIHPLVAPRQFPLKVNGSTLPCDSILDIKILKEQFPDFELVNEHDLRLWDGGINTLPEVEFRELASDFIEWCRSLNQSKRYIVSHTK